MDWRNQRDYRADRLVDSSQGKTKPMTFLVPALLFALPLAALPVVIHLIHRVKLHEKYDDVLVKFLLARIQKKGGR